MQSRPCWAEVDTRAIEDNFRFLSGLAAPHADLLAIVKANAYGHGLSLCAPAVTRAGARWLGVTSVEEGAATRALSSNAAILVISGVFPGQGAEVIRKALTPVVWEPWHLDELESAAHAAGLGPASLPVHLEIDTGMNRQGVLVDNLPQLLARFTPASPLRLEGVMTHLFAADEADGLATQDQLSQLTAALDQISRAGLTPQWLNVGNSAALLAGKSEDIAALSSRYKMRALIRPGLALYGIVPSYDPAFDAAEPPSLVQARQSLRPALTWKSQVVSVHSVPAGAVVGYNATFVATEPMRLALIAAGYADGLDRQLGNRFGTLVHGQCAPIVGRISMDQAVLDVTDISGVAPGDEVVLLGTQGSETISAFDHAEATGTIPWEVLTRIGVRVPRIEI